MSQTCILALALAGLPLAAIAQRPQSPTAVFWFTMQVAMVLGFLTTCPANWLLVKWGVQSGM